MNPVRIVIIVVALVAAVLLALVVRGMISQPKTPPAAAASAAPPAPPMERVLVASVDLQVGDSLTKDNMTWQDWPAATINTAYVTDGEPAAPQGGAPGVITNARKTITDIATNGGPRLQAMVGSIVKEPIFKGEPITAKKIVRSGDSSYMAVRLQPGTRAISLPITAESGAGGFIQPGDRVDIYTTHPDASKQGGGGMVTESVIANALVLAIDQHTDAPKAGASQLGATITIEAPEASVTTIARARAQGGLTIALRSYADLAGGPRGPSVDDGKSIRIFRGGAAAEMVTAP